MLQYQIASRARSGGDQKSVTGAPTNYWITPKLCVDISDTVEEIVAQRVIFCAALTAPLFGRKFVGTSRHGRIMVTSGNYSLTVQVQEVVLLS